MTNSKRIMGSKHRISFIFATTFVGLVLFALQPDLVLARPRANLIRHKRVSDQRLAELETLLALANMRGRLVTVPVGFGRVDPERIGRKRRSIESILPQLQLRPESDVNQQDLPEIPIESWVELGHENGNYDY